LKECVLQRNGVRPLRPCGGGDRAGLSRPPARLRAGVGSLRDRGRNPAGPRGVAVPTLRQCTQGSAMRALALFLLTVVLLWEVDEVIYDGRNTAQLYQAAHHQGQKLKAEVRDRLNNDKT